MEQSKATALVEYMARQQRVVTAQELADYLHLSVRSVKSYVRDVNQQKADLIRSGNRGYTISNEKAREYLSERRRPQKWVLQTYQERARYINHRFLTDHTDQLDCYELSQELCFSVETIRSDVPKMNLSFNNLGVSYELHGDKLCLKGDERALRRLSRSTLFADMENQMMDYETIQQAFPELNVDLLRQILQDVLRSANIYVNDFSMVNLTLHIAMSICRIRANQCIEQASPIQKQPGSPEFLAAAALRSRLEPAFQVTFNEAEYSDLYLLIRSNENIFLNDQQQDLDEFVGSDLIRFVRTLVRQLSEKYYINLNSNAFLMPFAMHIRNLLFRAKNHKSIVNPMCDRIRYSYPLIFDMAVCTAAILQETFQVEISESEISYLALHIGGEVERQRQNSEKVRTVLLCPQYLEFSSKLYNQLLLQFGDEMELIACVSLPEQLKQYHFSLLLTTVPLSSEPGERYQTVQIPYFGIKNCRTEISEALEEVREKRKLQILRQCFDDYFSPELFFVTQKDNLTGQEILRMMADRMLEAGVVQEDYYERLIEREIASSTAFPNIAVPHSMKMDAIKTSVGVLLCPKGVMWGGQRVRVVLTIAINQMDANLFSDLYQALIQLFDNEKNLRQILQVKTYSDFRTQLLDLF